MRKTEITVEGLRLLRDAGEQRLEDLKRAEAAGYPQRGPDAERRDRLRIAVGEATDRLLKAEGRDAE